VQIFLIYCFEMPSVLAIDIQSQIYSLTENNRLNCVLVCISFVSFCRFYKGAGVLEDCARRNGLLFWEKKFSISVIIRIGVFWNVTLCDRVNVSRRYNGRSYILNGRRRMIPTSDSWLVLLSVAQSTDDRFAFTGVLFIIYTN